MRGMKKSAAEIVKILGGVNATARFFGLKPPSVTEWVKVGEVPEERLIPKAASIETLSGGDFSRAGQFPDRYLEIWPELAIDPACSTRQPAQGGEVAHA